MADDRTADNFGASLARAQLSRRGFAVAAGGAAVAAGLSSPALAMIADPARSKLRRFEGAYAIDGHKVIDGYFVAPNSRTRLDVVLVVPGSASSVARVRAEADRLALAGAYAVAPRLPAGTDPAAATVTDTARRLKGFAHGTGKVRVVTV